MHDSINSYRLAVVEHFRKNELNWAMVFTGLTILGLWGWVGFGPLALTSISILSWWSFRKYFVSVGDNVTGNVLLLIILILGIYGISISSLSSIFSLGSIIQQGDIYNLTRLFKAVFIVIALLSLLVFVGCIRILFSNKNHSFPLKRIALATAVSIPLFIIFGVIGSFTFISQFGGILYDSIPEKTVYTDGQEMFHLSGDIGEGGDVIRGIFGDISGIFSFIIYPFIFAYKIIIVSPYVFLFLHFYKMKKRGFTNE